MINVAVIGSGYWGKNLVRNFDELGTLHTICDKNTATLKSFQERYPDKQFQSSFEAVLESPTIDAVVIATPAETHFELARRALSADKHTFVEKPLALVGGEAEELHRIAQDRNLKVMVEHILLYHPAIIKLKEIIDSGELGKINYIYSNRLNLGKFRTEENILWSFAPHDISVAVLLWSSPMLSIPEVIFPENTNSKKPWSKRAQPSAPMQRSYADIASADTPLSAQEPW